jgi:hypothetical protein
MVDRTWAPEVVKKVARGIAPKIGADFDRTPPDYIMTVVKNRPNQLGDWRNDVLILATAALSASPLPDALDLLEKIATNADGGWWTRDAAALVARVREG